MENTVENNMEQQAVQDDAVLEPLQEQEQEQQPLSSLDEITDQAQPADDTKQDEQQEPAAQKEPGWMRKKVDAAVERAIRETESRMRAEFDAQLAPIRESMYERQAEALVASGEIKSKERALEYVKAMAGIKSPGHEPDRQANVQPQPRDEQGRFTARQPEPDAESKARAQILAAQANKIKTSRGLDVEALYRTDPEVKAKILNGEWDFYDVAEMMNQPKRRVPSPVRSSNSAMVDNNNARAIANMSDAQFERLLKNLDSGKVYDMR